MNFIKISNSKSDLLLFIPTIVYNENLWLWGWGEAYGVMLPTKHIPPYYHAAELEYEHWQDDFKSPI